MPRKKHYYKRTAAHAENNSNEDRVLKWLDGNDYQLPREARLGESSTIYSAGFSASYGQQGAQYPTTPSRYYNQQNHYEGSLPTHHQDQSSLMSSEAATDGCYNLPGQLPLAEQETMSLEEYEVPENLPQFSVTGTTSTYNTEHDTVYNSTDEYSQGPTSEWSDTQSYATSDVKYPTYSNFFGYSSSHTQLQQTHSETTIEDNHSNLYGASATSQYDSSIQNAGEPTNYLNSSTTPSETESPFSAANLETDSPYVDRHLPYQHLRETPPSPAATIREGSDNEGSFTPRVASSDSSYFDTRDVSDWNDRLEGDLEDLLQELERLEASGPHVPTDPNSPVPARPPRQHRITRHGY